MSETQYTERYLMVCIENLQKRIAELERRMGPPKPPGPEYTGRRGYDERMADDCDLKKRR